MPQADNHLGTEKQTEADMSAGHPHLELDQLIHHTALPHTGISRFLDRVLTAIGQLMSWTWVGLMLVIMLNVITRYVFNEGRIEFEELQWHLYAVGWLFGLSYCFAADDHVRVDLLHDHLPLRAQGWVELFGLLFLLSPFLILVLWYAIPFVEYSWSLGEVSSNPGGLPYRWLIKAMLFVGFALLLLAMLSRLTRVFALLFGRPPGPSGTPTISDTPTISERPNTSETSNTSAISKEPDHGA